MTPQLKAILHREDKRYGSGCPVMGTVGQGCDSVLNSDSVLAP